MAQRRRRRRTPLEMTMSACESYAGVLRRGADASKKRAGMLMMQARSVERDAARLLGISEKPKRRMKRQRKPAGAKKKE